MNIMNREKIQKFSNVVRDKLETEIVSIAAFYGITEKSIKEPEATYEDSFILNGKRIGAILLELILVGTGATLTNQFLTKLGKMC